VVELKGNDEPEKFLTAAECAEWVRALMGQIPSDWQGDGVDAATLREELPPATPEEAQRIAAIKARLADAARPEPVYREDSKGLGGL
jgi:hypothetical protein